MTIATTQDLETSLMRELDETESRYASALLERAETLLLARAPELIQGILTDECHPKSALVAMIEADAVARVLRNPEAYTRETEGEYSYAINMSIASGLLKITDDEWLLLDMTPPGAGFGTINPTTDYAASHRGRWGGAASPELQFQYGWPGEGYPSTTIYAEGDFL